MTHELVFATVGGDGVYGRTAAWCVRSVRHFYPSATVYVGIPKCEEQSTPLPDVVTKDISRPIPGYAPSLKLAILKQLENDHPNSTRIWLDPDTLVVNPITLPESFDIAAKPGISLTDLPDSSWQDIYDHLDLPLPSRGKDTPGRGRWPYYDPAIIAFSEGTLVVDQWLNFEKELHTLMPNEYFIGMITFSSLAHDYNFTALTERQHFPLDLRFFAPESTEVMHYKEPKYLLKAYLQRQLLKDLEIWNEISLDWPLPKRWIRNAHDAQWVLRRKLRIFLEEGGLN